MVLKGTVNDDIGFFNDSLAITITSTATVNGLVFLENKRNEKRKVSCESDARIERIKRNLSMIFEPCYHWHRIA